MENKPIAIGLGNPFRSDDGIGHRVVDQLLTQGVPAKKRGDDLTLLIDDFSEYKNILLIDAINCQDLSCGTIQFFTLQSPYELQKEVNFSTHVVDLQTTLEMAKVLDKSPHNLRFMGIVGRNFLMGHQLTPELKKNIENYVQSAQKYLTEMEKDHA